MSATSRPRLEIWTETRRSFTCRSLDGPAQGFTVYARDSPAHTPSGIV
jgi:hypothetical protein